MDIRKKPVGEAKRGQRGCLVFHRQGTARGTFYKHGFQLILVVSLVSLMLAGCKRTVEVRVHNYLPVRVLVKRTTVPHDAYQTEKDLGWAEPNTVTTLSGTVGMDSESYRLRAFAPDGKLVAEINATQDQVEQHLHGNTWEVEIRKPNQAAGKPKHAPN